jgi:hypothetical protein
VVGYTTPYVISVDVLDLAQGEGYNIM